MGTKRTLTKGLLETWLKAKPSQKNFFKLEHGEVYCQPCSKRYPFVKVNQLYQHIDSKHHEKNVALQQSTGLKQDLVTTPVNNEFSADLCEAFLAADIPFKKLQVPKLRATLEKYCKTVVPCESTIRKNYLSSVYLKTMESIRKDIGDGPIFLQIDETNDACGRFVANVVVGKLMESEISKPHLIACKPLESANNATITQLVLDSLQFLWPTENQATISSRFWVLLTDAAAYMVLAGKNLKGIYPDLIHVTCLAHGINRVAEHIRGTFKEVDKVVGSVKAIFKKAPSRQRSYKTMFPDLPLPPEAVIVRWGTWLNSVDFLAENYEKLKAVIDTFSASDAKCIEKGQELFRSERVKAQLTDIKTNFSFVIKTIEKLEGRNLGLSDSLDLLEDVKQKLELCNSVHKDSIRKKLDDVLAKNSDLKLLCNVAKMLKGEIPTEKVPFDLIKICKLKFCPLTSVEVERSFSMAKSILSDRRQHFTMENFEMVLVCHFYNAIDLKSIDFDC